MIDFNLIKDKTLEDYNRNLNYVINRLNELEKYDKSGLLIRILNFDRGWLYGCCNKVLNVSQTSVIQNRDELLFFESLLHFFNYHIYDDGGITIKYEKYDINDGVYKECDKNASRARPFLRYASNSDDLASETDILKMLAKVEKMEMDRIKYLELHGFDDEPKYEKDYINYILK